MPHRKARKQRPTVYAMKQKENENDTATSTDSESDEDRRAGAGGSRKTNAIIARPNAAPGYWLCCLLPLAFGVHYLPLQQPPAAATAAASTCATPATYKMLTIAGLGMCVETLCFFMYMFLDTGLLPKLLISFLPGAMTTVLYMWLLQQSWGFGLFWGFAVTFCYQNAYIRVMRGLPCCFSYGEAAVLVQGLMLFVLNAVLQLPTLLFNDGSAPTEFAGLNAIMLSALFCLLATCWLLSRFKRLRQTSGFYASMVVLLVAVTCLPVTKPLPIMALLHFMLSDATRLNIVAFYLALVGLTIATVWWQQRHTHKATTSVRKIFHVLIVLVYVPGLRYQCSFLYIASGVALAIFTVLELFRILRISPLGTVLLNAFASFADDKDAGLLALTPFCLLIGCSLPLWLSPCPCNMLLTSDESASLRIPLPLLSGVLAIGFGDTAASVVGSKFGRTNWRNSSRTLEGTLAFVAALIGAIICLHATGYIALNTGQWLSAFTATVVSALIEAHTDQIDNLVLPLVFYVIASCG